MHIQFKEPTHTQTHRVYFEASIQLIASTQCIHKHRECVVFSLTFWLYACLNQCTE